MKKIIKHVAIMATVLMLISVIPAAVNADTVSAVTKLAAPSTRIHAASKTSITITWKAVKNAKGYQIYRSTSKKGVYKKIKTVKKATSLSFINKKLKSGKTYYYKVRAYKNIKKPGKYSSVKYCKATKAININAAISSKKKTTKTVNFKLTNKSYKNVNIIGAAFFLKNTGSVSELVNLYTKLQKGNYGDAFYMYKGSTKRAGMILKPGETVKVKFIRDKYTKFSKNSALIYVLGYKNANYGVITGPSYGTAIQKVK